MMSISRRSFFVLSAVTAMTSSADGHSLKEIEQSLYDKEKFFQAADSVAPDFTLQDAQGRAVKFADFKGKVVVLHFIYTNCPDVCPLHAERIALIQKMVNITPMKDQVQFISITTDPKHDTGTILRDYGTVHGLDPVNWTFLTAAPDQPEDVTRRLAKAYGLEFTITENGEQMHGVVTHVIDQDGHLRARFHGLEFAPVNLVIFINALVNRAQAPHHHDDERSWWDTVKAWF